MDYSLYKLNFKTPLHIGRDAGGPSLDNGQMAVHADTIFSALCCEAARDARLDRLVGYLREGALAFSDALPCAGEEFYLPKPVVFVANRHQEGDAGLKKRLKDIEYIPLSGFNDYLKNLSGVSPDFAALEQAFGQLNTIPRVAIQGHDAPQPYHVASWRFANGCGLYLIIGYTDQQARDLAQDLLVSLGLSGIGGKSSSGYGKCEVTMSPLPDALLSKLEDLSAGYQMLLGTALPAEDELDELLQQGWYTLIRRGGFIRSQSYAPGQLKKKTMYMLGPGSCLRRRFRGGLHDLSDQGGHPVWRSAHSLFVGVNI